MMMLLGWYKYVWGWPNLLPVWFFAPFIGCTRLPAGISSLIFGCRLVCIHWVSDETESRYRSWDHFETKMSHYIEWRDWFRDHFRDQSGLDSGLETGIDTKMSYCEQHDSITKISMIIKGFNQFKNNLATLIAHLRHSFLRTWPSSFTNNRE